MLRAILENLGFAALAVSFLVIGLPFMGLCWLARRVGGLSLS